MQLQFLQVNVEGWTIPLHRIIYTMIETYKEERCVKFCLDNSSPNPDAVRYMRIPVDDLTPEARELFGPQQ